MTDIHLRVHGRVYLFTSSELSKFILACGQYVDMLLSMHHLKPDAPLCDCVHGKGQRLGIRLSKGYNSCIKRLQVIKKIFPFFGDESLDRVLKTFPHMKNSKGQVSWLPWIVY